MAFQPCLQEYVLASPLDIAVDLVSHNPGQGNQALVVVLWGALVVTADCMDCPLRMAGLSFWPLGPWNQAAGHSRDTRIYINHKRTKLNETKIKCLISEKK